MRFNRTLGLVVGCAIALTFTGCSPSAVKVTGTVLKDGKPLTVGPTGAVEVTLIPDVPAGTPFTTFGARCEPDGKFEILGVKPGKYKVAVELHDPTPQVDKLNGAFSQEKTPIVREIDGKKPLDIDLAKP